jgi:CheY-like chemotaxis protein
MLLTCTNCGTNRDYSILEGDVSCPACGAGEDALRPAEETESEGEPPHTVLVAEDDEAMLESYRLWLADDDRWDVREAADGQETLDELDAAVDVLVLDREMPEHTGDEIVDRLDDSLFEGDILVVSAYGPDSYLSDADVAGYLTKPIREETFRTALEAVREDE